MVRMRLRILCLPPVFAVLAANALAQQQPLDPTAALLVDLSRVNTSNPPGNEGGIGALLAPRFKALGFETAIIPTPDSGKAHFIARLVLAHFLEIHPAPLEDAAVLAT